MKKPIFNSILFQVWVCKTAVFLVLVSSVGPRLIFGQDDTHGKLHVTFFYNASMFKDSVLTNETAKLLNDGCNVDLEIVPYVDSSDFCALYRRKFLTESNRADIVLGPSDSDSLKSLDKTLDKKAPSPFLAPFVTTSPSEYHRLTLISASPTDEYRVRKMADAFVKYIVGPSFGCLHTDDPWGQGIVKHFRKALPEKVVVHSQPIAEQELDATTGAPAKKDNQGVYHDFIGKMRDQGVTAIAVALLHGSSINSFFETFNQFNNDVSIHYAPTILLLNPPSFSTNNLAGSGILPAYARDHRIVYVKDHLKGDTADDRNRTILQHLDACTVIAAASRIWPPASNVSLKGGGEAVRQIAAFYSSTWPEDHVKDVAPHLRTGFHQAKVSIKSEELDVERASYRNGRVEAKDAIGYFQSGYWTQIACRTYFFFGHHRSLWHPLLLLVFILVCFFTFFQAVSTEAMKSRWLIWRTHFFWTLFGVNLVLTYLVWVASIYFGVMNDASWGAVVLLATLCPTAASALSDLTKRFLPVINLRPIAKMIDEVTSLAIRSIGRDLLIDSAKSIERFGAEALRGVFFDRLWVEVEDERLRDRLGEQLTAEVKKASESHATGSTLQTIYSKHLVRLVCLNSRNESDFRARIQELIQTLEEKTPARDPGPITRT